MQKYIYLKKDYVYDCALQRKERLEKFIALLEARVVKAPHGTLRIIENKNTTQYYHITEKGDRNGKYISKKDFSLIKELAQRDYDAKVLANVKKQLYVLSDFLQTYSPSSVEEVFTKVKENRKALIVPATLPNKNQIENWLSVKYKGHPFSEDDPELYTARGLRVRSKSEVIIADTLDRMNIPFRYEFPVKLQNFSVNPDFFCLNPDTCEEYIWEHFGLMDNEEYSKNAVKKIAAYQKKGYFPGKNLILTFETQEVPLSSKTVEEIIKQYFM